MGRPKTIREMRQAQAKSAERRHSDKRGRGSKAQHKRRQQPKKYSLTLITLNSGGIAVVGTMALVLMFRIYLYAFGKEINAELQSLIVMLGFIILYLASMLVLLNKYMPKGWLAAQEKRIAKAVAVETPVEEKWGGSLVPSGPRSKEVFAHIEDDDPAESLLDDAEAAASDVAPFEATVEVEDPIDDQANSDGDDRPTQEAEEEPEEEVDLLSGEQMQDLLGQMESLICAVTEAIQIRDGDPDVFTKFGLNLYFAGVCSRLSRHFKLKSKEARAVLARLMQLTGSDKKGANSFFDHVNEYGERFHYRRMIDAGDAAMARLFKAGDSIYDAMEQESDTVNALLDEWSGQEGSIEMPTIFTFMFTDIVEMTATEDGIGMANIQKTLRVHNRIVRTALERHSGQEVKQTSNGIMATFTWTEKAIEAAQQIQQEIDLYSQANPDSAFKVRIGIHEGEAIHEENDFYGTAVQTAARICTETPPEKIWVSEEVLPTLPGEDDRFKSCGSFELKGLSQAKTLYRVGWDRMIYRESREVEYTEIGNVPVN